MALQAIIGQNFSVQFLFVDSLNTPVTVTDPTITVFRYKEGVKTDIAAAQPMVLIETGRYGYTFTVPSDLEAADSIYAEATAVNPDTLQVYLVEQQIIAVNTAQLGQSAMRARFVQGG